MIIDGMLILLGLIGIFFMGYLIGITKIRNQAVMLGFASYEGSKFVWSGKWNPEVREYEINDAVNGSASLRRDEDKTVGNKKRPDKKG